MIQTTVLRYYPGVTAEAFIDLPFPLVLQMLERVPEWEYRSHIHTAQFTHLTALAHQVQSESPEDWLYPFAHPARLNVRPLPAELADDWLFAFEKSMVPEEISQMLEESGEYERLKLNWRQVN